MKRVSELKKYCSNIETDPNTGHRFFKLPISSYTQLEYLRAAIASSIHFMAVNKEHNTGHFHVDENIMLLVELLTHLQVHDECEALDIIAE